MRVSTGPRGRVHAPDTLPPQLLGQHNRPHRLLSVARARTSYSSPQLALVSNNLSIHPSLDHPEEHSLHSAVELVVLGTQVRCANVGQNSPADEGTERGRSCPRKQRKQSLEEPESNTGMSESVALEAGTKHT